jgi:diacylglycerol kinase
MEKYKLKSRLNSFRAAFRGIRVLIQEEPNAQIHLLATAFALGMGYYHHISVLEWVAVLFCIGAVLSLEAINTALENLADAVTTKPNPFIRNAKDVAAGGVLIMALVSVVIAAIIFLPKMF